ncbi:MAG TPA: ester cyclase [Anaerolineales bacterium]|nr:ester cyclase [Anaerolineales bacterium]
MSIFQGKSIVRRVLDESFNQGKLATVDELVAPHCISHHLSWGTPPNRMGLKQLIAMFRTAFPDLNCTVEDEINQADKVAAHWMMRGTHSGRFLGNLPTGKSIAVQGLIYVHIENEQVTESWIMIDQMSILQQLGLIPPPLHDHGNN